MKNEYFVLEDGSACIRVWEYKEQRTRDCFIDAVDLPLIDAYRCNWSAQRVKGTAAKWYALGKSWTTGVGNRTVMMHRVILGLTDPMIEAHHRDNDGLNNRRDNLKECDHLENMRFKQPGKDWEAYDGAQQLAAEYRKEREIAARIEEQFDLTRQALWFIRRHKTTTSPAAKAYKAECLGICRPHWIMRDDHPVENVKWGAVRVSLVEIEPR